MSQQDKRVRWSKAAIETFSEEEQLFKLSGREVSALQTAIAVMDWQTRWIDGDITFYSPFAGKLTEKLMTPIDFCAEMINCIQNDADVQAALQNYLQITGQNGGVGNPNQPLPGTILDGNIIPLDALCTPANKYAMSLAVVQILNRATVDFFEQVEIFTNGAEYAVTLADNAGVWSAAPASAAETAAWLQDSIQEEYDAAYNLVTEEKFACAIYCQFSGCNLSFENIYQAYQSVISVTLPDVNNIFTVIDFLIDIATLNDTLVVGTSHLLALTLLRWGSNWANIGGYPSVQAAIEASKNEEFPVPEACECDTGWGYEVDFTSELGLYNIQNGTFVSGVGIVSESFAGQEFAQIWIEFDNAYTPDRVSITYTRASSGSALDDVRAIQWTDINTVTGRFDWLERNDTETGNLNYCPAPPPPAASRKQLAFYLRDNEAGQQVIFKSIKIFALTGSNPPAPLSNNSSPDC